MNRMLQTSGRRPGDTKTRDSILAAAQKSFADHGYDQTTIRAIATKAKVDPALVMHFFKSKDRLFVEAIQPIYRPLDELQNVLAGPIENRGYDLAVYMIEFLDSEQGKIAVGLVRASLNEPTSAMIDDLHKRKIVAVLAAAAATDCPHLRATLLCSQYIGLVMARYINKIEPLASCPKEQVVAFLAPVLQRYINGSISEL